jgi:hypothetical protein
MHDDHDLIRSLQRAGEVIDDAFRLGPVLGVGGMGVVYAATQCSLGRTVALKLPRPELTADPEVRARFHTEALAGCRVNHRNVAHVLDFGDAGGVPYLVMEHVAGPRLGDLVLAQGPLPVAFAAELVGEILAGLGDAHANRVIHSDVKCNNILVQTARDGTAVPRLIDFGIARFVDEDGPRRAGEARLIAGTPEYLAPELIRGDAPTFASDVYATGVLLYELVTGTTPFGGGTKAQILSRQLEDEPAPLSRRAPGRDVPAALDEIVARALAKRPADRFADAAAFGAALARVTLDGAGAPWGPQLAGGAPVFSTGGATATMRMSAPPRLAMCGRDRVRSRVDERRHAVGAAILRGDVDAIVVAYLELSRALIDEHRLALAIAELEEGVELLSASDTPARRAPLWRLLLSLAALYAGHGDREKARAITCTARAQAVAAGSAVGRERAELLWTRLVRGDPAARTPPPWCRAPLRPARAHG